MPYHLPPLNSLRAFEAAARHLSFKKAAQELHVTPAAISHQVKGLEESLGVKLFHRLPRGLRLTDEAQSALPKLREGFDCLAAAIERTRRHGMAGILTVSTPPSFATRWLVPRLQLFAARYPDVDLRISTTMNTIDDRRDDAPAGIGLAGVRDGDADVTIRFGSGRYPGCRVDKVFAVSYIPVCSPRLSAGEPPLRQPEDLRNHTLLHDDTLPDLAERPSWDQWLKAAGVPDVDVSRGPHFNSSVLALEAAVDGLGVALGMRPLVAPDIAAGRLVAPFDISVPSGFAYYLVCAEAVADRPRVAAFRDWLLEEARNDSAPG
ncbi:MAG: transcriptional regulator GcvA [Betaproteobacteria bacterium]|nr:transcriptional regulator GcvA [Betaproteobacteria bacterium]